MDKPEGQESSPGLQDGIPTCPQKPWMTDEELECFLRWIPKAGLALEFGMGGSTRACFEAGVGRLYSVDSDPVWVEAMIRDPFLCFFIHKKRLSLYHADIGPVRQHGLPCGSPNITWLNYH